MGICLGVAACGVGVADFGFLVTGTNGVVVGVAVGRFGLVWVRYPSLWNDVLVGFCIGVWF